VLKRAYVSFLVVDIDQLDGAVNVLVHWALAIPDLFEDLLVFDRLIQALGANSEQVVACGRATIHHAVRSAAAALEDDDECVEAHLLRLVKRLEKSLVERMFAYVECVKCVLRSGFLWLVFECLSIEKPHFRVRADRALSWIKATLIVSCDQTSFLLLRLRKSTIDRAAKHNSNQYVYAFALGPTTSQYS
jgi:hypothetical protein